MEDSNGENLRNELNHDEKPPNRQIPVKPVEIPSLSSNDAAAGILPPQSVETDEILNNRHGSQQGGADTEDSIGRQLVASETVPHAKVEANRHADAVENDEGPEPENGLLAGSQRVVEWWWTCKVGVIVCDLGVGEESVSVWRWSATWLCAWVEACCVIGSGYV